MGAYVDNNDEWFGFDSNDTEGKPMWVLGQRNVGFAQNDGQWTAQRVRGNVWKYGILTPIGESKFLGIHATRDEAVAAIDADRKG